MPNPKIVSAENLSRYDNKIKSYIKKQVTANPIGTGSTDLTKLEVGGTVYNIPSGGSGGAVYQHFISIQSYNEDAGQFCYIELIKYISTATPFTFITDALGGYFVGWYTLGGSFEPFNSATIINQNRIGLDIFGGSGDTFYPAEDATITDIVTQI